MWYDRRPHRRHSVCVLLRRLPADQDGSHHDQLVKTHAFELQLTGLELRCPRWHPRHLLRPFEFAPRLLSNARLLPGVACRRQDCWWGLGCQWWSSTTLVDALSCTPFRLTGSKLG